tara:strand:+ start:1223 stop:6427 length:5205 start_codon:yes stop_codon:yes gene_type:complete
VQEEKENSLNEVISKFLTHRGTYDFYMPLQTIFACFIFIRLFITTASRVVSKSGSNWRQDDHYMPRLLGIRSDWEKIQLNDPDSLLIIKRQLKIVPDLLKEITEDSTSFHIGPWNDSGMLGGNRKLIFTISSLTEIRKVLQEISRINEKTEGIKLNALTSLIKWVMDQPEEAFGLEASQVNATGSLLEKFDEIVEHPSLASHNHLNNTPKSIARLMASIAEQQLSGRDVYDPCFGSGYLLTAFHEIEKKIPSDLNIVKEYFGNEIDGQKFIIGYTRLLLSGATPRLLRDDALNQTPDLLIPSILNYTSSFTQDTKFDVVLANPPWASEYKGYEELKDIFPEPTSDTAGLLLQQALSKLRNKGLAVLILPEGFFYKNSDRGLRKELVNNNDVKAIISLPDNVLPYTSIRPHILVVRKGGATKKIRMINAEQYFEKNKLNLDFELSDKNLTRLLKDITGKEKTIAWDISIEEIIEREWDLTPKAPNNFLPTLVESLGSRNLLLKDCCEILTGNHIDSVDLIDRPASKKKTIDSIENITQSQHVLSVSAAETKHLIEKYQIHSCPSRYFYEGTDFISFRLPPQGAMETIYKIEKILYISEKKKMALIDKYFPSDKGFVEVAGDEKEIELDQNEMERLAHYLKACPFKKNDRFYFLSEFKKLPQKFIPAEYNNEPAYLTIGEMLGNEVPDSLVDESKSKDILYIGIKDIQQNHLISQTRYLTPEASASINEEWKINSGDVLLSKTGTIWKTLFVQRDIAVLGALASQNFFVLRPKRNLLAPQYLQAYLLGRFTQTWLQDNARGGTLSKSVLEKLKIPLPDIEEQLKFAFDMTKDKWDVLIREVLSTDSDDSGWKYIERWIEVARKRLKEFEEADLFKKEDQVNLGFLIAVIYVANAGKDKVLKTFNANEEKPDEDESNLKNWFFDLVDILNDLKVVSDIPRGATLTSVLSNAILKIENLTEHGLVYEGCAGYVDEDWDWIDPRYHDAYNLNEHLITILKLIIQKVSKDVKLTFEVKENTIRIPELLTSEPEMVECEVGVSNLGSIAVINLTVDCNLDIDRCSDQQVSSDYSKYLSWGTASSSCLSEKEQVFLKFSGYPPKARMAQHKFNEFSLNLSWKALCLDGSVIKGSQQIPLRLVYVPKTRNMKVDLKWKNALIYFGDILDDVKHNSWRSNVHRLYFKLIVSYCGALEKYHNVFCLGKVRLLNVLFLIPWLFMFLPLIPTMYKAYKLGHPLWSRLRESIAAFRGSNGELKKALSEFRESLRMLKVFFLEFGKSLKNLVCGRANSLREFREALKNLIYGRRVNSEGEFIEARENSVSDKQLNSGLEIGGSPYVAGDPVGNNENVFFGREELIRSICRQVVENGNVILLEGNRRAGKTSILHYLRGSTRIPGWLAVYCSLQGAKGSADNVGVPTEEIFREMAISISKGIANIGIECLLPNNKILVPGNKFGIAKACREGIGMEAPFADFREYLETILEILEKNKLGLVLMTDEFDKLQEGIDNHVTSPQVPENIRSLIHQYPRFSAILTGSRRLKRLREEYWSALFGLGTRVSVSALEHDDAIKLITEPVQGRLIFTNDAVEKICFLTASQPYLTQCLCTRIFDLAARENNTSITVDVVNNAATLLIENNEHFASLWDYVRRDRRRFLLALFQKESKNPDLLRLGIIQEKLLSLNIKVRDEVLSEDLEYLQELELIKLIGKGQDGQYELQVPLMGNWIDSHQDFEALKSKAINDMED